MKEIQLTQGKVSLVDDDMYDYLTQWKWFAVRYRNSWYAERKEGWPRPKNIKMHRVIMEVTDPKIEVDHWDNDGLNNVDENLRVCTHAQNMKNQRKRINNTSGFKGVSWDKANMKYRSKITVNGKQVHLGLFTDPKEAARAYDAAAKRLHGEFAALNFKGMV